MAAKPIVMDGASMDASYIASFTREAFIDYNMKVHTFEHKPVEIRIKQLSMFYDIAAQAYPEEFPNYHRPAKKKK